MFAVIGKYDGVIRVYMPKVHIITLFWARLDQILAGFVTALCTSTVVAIPQVAEALSAGQRMKVIINIIADPPLRLASDGE